MFGDPKPSSDLNLSALVVFVHASAKRIIFMLYLYAKMHRGDLIPSFVTGFFISNFISELHWHKQTVSDFFPFCLLEEGGSSLF